MRKDHAKYTLLHVCSIHSQNTIITISSRLHCKFCTHAHMICNSLVGLSLRCCKLQDDHLSPLCDALAEDCPLQQLDLGQNSLSDDGLRLISESLRMNRNLISLSLSGNKITDIGISYIAVVNLIPFFYMQQFQ